MTTPGVAGVRTTSRPDDTSTEMTPKTPSRAVDLSPFPARQEFCTIVIICVVARLGKYNIQVVVLVVAVVPCEQMRIFRG